MQDDLLDVLIGCGCKKRCCCGKGKAKEDAAPTPGGFSPQSRRNNLFQAAPRTSARPPQEEESPFIPPIRLTLAPLPGVVRPALVMLTRSVVGNSGAAAPPDASGGVTGWTGQGDIGSVADTRALREWALTVVHPEAVEGRDWRIIGVASAPAGTSRMDRLYRVVGWLREGVEVAARVLTFDPISGDGTLGAVISTGAGLEAVEKNFAERNSRPTVTPADAAVGTLTLATAPRLVQKIRGGGGIYRLHPAEAEHPARVDDLVRLGEALSTVRGVARRALDVYSPVPLTLPPGASIPVIRRGGNLPGASRYSFSTNNIGELLAHSQEAVIGGWRPVFTRLTLTTDATPDRQPGRWQGGPLPDMDPDWPSAALRRTVLRGRDGDVLQVDLPALPPYAEAVPLNVTVTYRIRRPGVFVTMTPSWYPSGALFQFGEQTGRHWRQWRPNDNDMLRPSGPGTLTFRAHGGEVEISSIVLEAVETRRT